MFMAEVFHRYSLAMACVVLPAVALGAIFGAAGWMTRSARIECIELGYQFRDHKSATTPETIKREQTSMANPEAAKSGQAGAKPEAAKSIPETAWRTMPEPPCSAVRQAAGSGETAPAPRIQTVAPKSELLSEDPNVKTGLVARHFSGHLGFAIATGVLWLAAIFLLLFASGAIRSLERDQRLTLAQTLSPKRTISDLVWMIPAAWIFAVATVFGFSSTRQFRLLVFSNVFAVADAHPWLNEIPVGESILHLVHFNIFLGIWAVGVLLFALARASVRPQRTTSPSENDLKTRQDQLALRLSIITAALMLASVVLVLNVTSTKVLVDWPLSLLADEAREALAPAGSIIVQQWGVLGTVALIVAFAPAITAWHLDRDDYLKTKQAIVQSTPPAKSESPTSGAAKTEAPAAKPGVAESPPAQQKPPAGKSEDALDVKLTQIITAVIALLAPMIASPLISGLQSLFSALTK
jgi:hypothetical protein